jgi:hypothetical protein
MSDPDVQIQRTEVGIVAAVAVAAVEAFDRVRETHDA